MTPERLAKIEEFKYTPEGNAAQCFIDELTAEIRQSWAYIRTLEKAIELHDLALNHHPNHRQANTTEDT